MSDKRIDDGGPAFLGDYTRKHPTLKEHGLPADERVSSPGLSLRDYFAAAALTGFLANPSVSGGIVVDGKKLPHADACYAMADAMLKARSQP